MPNNGITPRDRDLDDDLSVMEDPDDQDDDQDDDLPDSDDDLDDLDDALPDDWPSVASDR